MRDAVKISAASLLIALALYCMGAFISLEPDVLEWEKISRALLVWLWLVGSIAAAGIVKSRGL